MPTNEDLLARYKAVLPSWRSLFYQAPIALVSGQGRHVTDADGVTYLDFFGGILTTSLGHNLEEVTAAIHAQVDRILHSSTLYLIEQEIELAERIAPKSGIDDARVFFVNSGSEANETALMLSTVFRRSPVVLALRDSYHGRSFATLAVSGNSHYTPGALSPLAVTFVDAGSPEGPFSALGGDELVAAVRRDVRHLFESAIPADPACFIFEPIQGVGGYNVPAPGVIAAIGEVVAEHGGLMISDEVQTGWGRTGSSYFGFGLHGVQPDLITFAKGLANGMPIGGVVASQAVMESFGVDSISTFGGNPVATAAAIATLDYIDAHDLPAHVEAMGSKFREGLGRIAAERPFVHELRGAGLMLGVECRDSLGSPSRAIATALLEASKSEGLLVGRGGLAGNVLRFAPPMTVTEAEIDDGLERLDRAFKAVADLPVASA